MLWNEKSSWTELKLIHHVDTPVRLPIIIRAIFRWVSSPTLKWRLLLRFACRLCEQINFVDKPYVSDATTKAFQFLLFIAMAHLHAKRKT